MSNCDYKVWKNLNEIEFENCAEGVEILYI